MTDNSNMVFWNTVYRTDPEYTKPYQGAGGFKGTAISGLYFVQRATELFGPAGGNWGYEILESKFVEGGPMYNKEGTMQGMEQTHFSHVKVWFIVDNKKMEATHYGTTPYVGMNKWGPYTDHEAPKKSVTDAIKKAMVMFGFSADVYMGQHDDQDYIRAISNDFAIAKAEDKDAELAKQNEEYEEFKAKNLKLMKSAVRVSELEALYKTAVRRAMQKNDDDFQKKLVLTAKERKAALMAAEESVEKEVAQ